jgi:predicted XRE-type DNA-binding protein
MRAYFARMSRVDPIPALKRELGGELARLLSGWNNDDIACLIGTDRRRIPELRGGKLDRFSLETLIRYLARLQRQVQITITEDRGARPKPPFDRRRDHSIE